MSMERRVRKDRKAQSGFAVSAGFAFVVYLALTMVMTWPLAADVAHNVPGDFGDPLLQMWILAWDATHLGAGWWSANIFAPHPLSLAYSEHLLPQALQAWPIYAATNNPILCYNLVFLSTFALSGLGMFLLGRELTGSAAAGFVAGLAFAFSPYRAANVPHMQVLSAAWMPFVLYGLHRHFATGRARPLAGAAAAWLTQNLSCGYYLLFFTPIVFFYIAWELTRRELWTTPRALIRVGIACAAVLTATAPFLLPYVELRRLGFDPRSLEETRRFSADVYGYFTADPNLRLWGPIAQAWPRGEGLLFPGLTIVVLAVLGAARSRERKHPALQLLEIVMSAIVFALLLGFTIRLPGIRIASLSRALIVSAIAGAIAAGVSRDAREAARRFSLTPAGIFTAITAFAIVMSFGPDIHAMGRTVLPTNVYALFYQFVPGFDGVRVPARYAMIVTLGFCALGAIGIAAIDRRHQGRVAVVAGALILLEGFAVPMPVNQRSTEYKQPGLAPLPEAIAWGPAAPEVYRFAARLPPSAVLIELPFGEPAFDVRYTLYSTLHWRRLVNGYSGGAPADYLMWTESLKDMFSRPDRAWQAVAASTATHAIVHEAAYTGDGAVRVENWLRAYGAREIAAFGSDRVFLIPGPIGITLDQQPSRGPREGPKSAVPSP